MVGTVCWSASSRPPLWSFCFALVVLLTEDALLHAPAPPCLLHAIACGGIGVRSACANFAWMPIGPPVRPSNSAANVAG